MTKRNFWTKGIGVLLVMALIGWVGSYFYIVEGQVDFFRLALTFGIPVGFPYMVFVIPHRWGLSATVGMLAFCVVIGGLFGSLIAAGLFFRAVFYIIAVPVSRLKNIIK